MCLWDFVTCTVHEYHLPGNKANTTCWLCCLDHVELTDCCYNLWSMICRCVLPFSFCVFLATMIQLVFLLFYCLLVNSVILENFFPKLRSTNNNRVTQLYHVSRFSNLDAVFMEVCILPYIWFDFNPCIWNDKSWAEPRNEADIRTALKSIHMRKVLCGYM